MRQALRSLGWAISIFWIVLLLFTISVAYSALQIRPSFGEPSVTGSGSALTTSLPLILYNGGFFDISKLNITTLTKDYRGSLITSSMTIVPLIPRGTIATINHNISLAIDRAATGNLSHLLFLDSELDVETSLSLVYAGAFPFEISLDMNVPWGAPFANLTLGEIVVAPLNLTHFRASVPLSFENHSFLDMNGTIRLEIVDFMNQTAGVGSVGFDAPPSSLFRTNVQIFVSGDPANMREARLNFQTPFFNYGPMVVSLV
jgi:hypothetical protein